MKISLKVIIIASIFASFLVLGGIVRWLSKDKPENQINNSGDSTYPVSQIHSTCLADDEWATVYPRYWYFSANGQLAEDVSIYTVKKGEINFDSVSGEELEKQLKNKSLFSFSINDVRSNAYAPDVLRCGIYVVRVFENGNKYELWHYDYSGKGRNILILDEYGKDGNSVKGINSYESYAKVDPIETYVALIRSWVGDENHALVIKNLKTMEDVYVVTLKELVEKYGIEPGTISLADWYKQYYRFTVLNDERPFFKIDTINWEMEFFNDLL